MKENLVMDVEDLNSDRCVRKRKECVCCGRLIVNKQKNAKYCLPCGIYIQDYQNRTTSANSSYINKLKREFNKRLDKAKKEVLKMNP